MAILILIIDDNRDDMELLSNAMASPALMFSRQPTVKKDWTSL